MERYPTISIITITFNAERYLEQTIASVAAQKYPNLEYFIVDGGSTDRTLEIVKGHESLVTRWISEPDAGISDAFNKGIRMATGEIIGIINADDYYHPGALKAVAKAAVEYPKTDVYYGDAVHERFDGSGVFRYRAPRDISRHIWSRMPISHPATFVRKSTYDRFGLFDTNCRLAMDYDFVLRLYRGGARFRYVNEVLTHFRYGQGLDRSVCGIREVRDVAIRHGLHPVRAYWHYFIAALKSNAKAMLKTPRSEPLSNQ
jgi:glycosyltransferase involved in cell wall biosynthesis